MTPTLPSRLRILMSAYSCEPGKGSEPGLGWNIATEVARHHDVWVLTRANNRSAIEQALPELPEPHPRFAYLDLPPAARFWKRGAAGTALYYYLWQLLVYRRARTLHESVGFHVAHHVTFAKYAAPSLLSLLPVPFVWGPVGGGESIPGAFLRELAPAPRMREEARRLARWIAERDPLVRLTARRSALALVTTPETAERARNLGARSCRVFSVVGIPRSDLTPQVPPRSHDRFRFVSAARLADWKGFHLGLRAFAQAGLKGAEYWIIGDGPARARLQAIATELGLGERVRFLGSLSREATLEHLARSHALVHPSLHEAGGWICAEAMMAGCPVICLDLGGPALEVSDACGFRVPATIPDQSVAGIADAMRRLAEDASLWLSLSRNCREQVSRSVGWDRRGEELSRLYAPVLGELEARGDHALVHA